MNFRSRVPEVQSGDYVRQLEVARRDCRALLWHLDRVDEFGVRWLLLADLLARVSSLPSSERHEFERAAYRIFLGCPFQGEVLTLVSRQRRLCVLVPKFREIRGVLGGLGLSASGASGSSARGYRSWEVLTDDIRIFVTLVGEERGVHMSAAVDFVVEEFAPDCAVLCGVAAGLKGKTAFGDVVLAERVFDYEGEVVTTESRLPRPEFIELPDVTTRDLAYFLIAHENLRLELPSELLGQRQGVEPEGRAAAHEWTVMTGSVASGEKLLLDGAAVEAIRAKIDERVRAVDQESWAFAKACERNEVPWLVVRGVSDFGEPTSFEGMPLGNEQASRSHQSWAAAGAAHTIRLLAKELSILRKDKR